MPRLPWGASDLQGVWLYQTYTPLERPEAFTDKAVLSPEEAAAYLAEEHARRAGERSVTGDWGLDLPPANRRTSQIIDPPNGRLPARTGAAQRRAQTIGSPPGNRTANGPEDREPPERCILGRSVPFRGLFFDQRVQIFQSGMSSS